MNNMNLPLRPRERTPRDMPNVSAIPPAADEPQQPAWPGEDEYTPVIPLPPFVEPPTGEPVVPLPPFVEPPEGEPVIPLPPFVEPPAGEPVIPLPPIVVPPQQPVYPNPGYCTVRFLHAAANYEPLCVRVGTRGAACNLAFGGMSSYVRVPDGFYTVTISTAATPSTLLYRSTIPFRAGDVITMAITRTSGGIDLTPISDTPCVNRPRNRACIRAINLVYNTQPLDVILNDGRVVYSDIRYKEVTPFKLARPQEYGMYIAQTPYALSSTYTDIETLDDMPVVLANYYLPGYGDVSPLASFYVDAKAGGMYTIYILGMWNGTPQIRTKVVEDF